jgi:MoaA/NifB/PqqE/SkfB family radical SAM enzyme
MGEVSRRQNENNRYEKYFDRISTEVSPTPVHIDIKFGNLCNLKCRICSSINSNAWVTEEIALYGKADSNTTSAWIEPESPIWNDLEQMIPTLETLYLSGGEPLLLKHHWKFLDKCFEMQRSDQIEIRYITNGTISVTDTQLETWSKFKKIRLLVSIDDIEERFEYQRYPAKWNTVKENLLKFKEIQNIEIGIVCSVSIFNVYYLPELIKECYSLGIPQSDIYMNFVRKPVEFDASLLTISQKQMIIDHLQQCDDALVTQVISYLKTSSEITSDEFLGKMRDNDLTIDNYRLSIISKSDQYRNQNFKDYFPEMAGILNAD